MVGGALLSEMQRYFLTDLVTPDLYLSDFLIYLGPPASRAFYY